MDIMLQGKMNGVEAAGQIHNQMNIPIIYLTSYITEDILEQAKMTEPFGYLIKPFEKQYLFANIEIALHKAEIEKKLRESEEKFRIIADFTYDWETWRGTDGKYIYVSPSCKRITGYTCKEFFNDPWLKEKITHPDDRKIVRDHIRRFAELGDFAFIDFRIITRKGHERWITHHSVPVYDSNGNWIGRRASNRDISRHKRTESELLKAKKFEAACTIANGITHDFNNLLFIILGNIQLAKTDLSPESTVMKELNAAERACLQARGLTEKFITFSKGGTSVKVISSVANIIRNTTTHLLSSDNIGYEYDIPEDLWKIDVDSNQIQLAIRNIILNAIEAMPQGGMIKIGVENIEVVGNHEKGELSILKDGKYIKISVADQGKGISNENMPKIFDPYFSTKARGSQKGMGMGFAIANLIIESHNGYIYVESKLGKKTVVYIYLPAVSKAETPKKVLIEKIPPIKVIPPIKRVLVMDDEEMIRHLMRKILTRLGYDVEVARHGEEAIQLYEEAQRIGKQFDMVILDLTVKIGMGGIYAIKNLLKKDPNVKAFISSGYLNDPVLTDFKDYGFIGAIPKPSLMKDVAEALQKLAD